MAFLSVAEQKRRSAEIEKAMKKAREKALATKKIISDAGKYVSRTKIVPGRITRGTSEWGEPTLTIEPKVVRTQSQTEIERQRLSQSLQKISAEERRRFSEKPVAVKAQEALQETLQPVESPQYWAEGGQIHPERVAVATGAKIGEWAAGTVTSVAAGAEVLTRPEFYKVSYHVIKSGMAPFVASDIAMQQVKYAKEHPGEFIGQIATSALVFGAAGKGLKIASKSIKTIKTEDFFPKGKMKGMARVASKAKTKKPVKIKKFVRLSDYKKIRVQTKRGLEERIVQKRESAALKRLRRVYKRQERQQKKIYVERGLYDTIVKNLKKQSSMKKAAAKKLPRYRGYYDRKPVKPIYDVSYYDKRYGYIRPHRIGSQTISKLNENIISKAKSVMGRPKKETWWDRQVRMRNLIVEKQKKTRFVKPELSMDTAIKSKMSMNQLIGLASLSSLTSLSLHSALSQGQTLKMGQIQRLKQKDKTKQKEKDTSNNREKYRDDDINIQKKGGNYYRFNDVPRDEIKPPPPPPIIEIKKNKQDFDVFIPRIKPSKQIKINALKKKKIKKGLWVHPVASPLSSYSSKRRRKKK